MYRNGGFISGFMMSRLTLLVLAMGCGAGERAGLTSPCVDGGSCPCAEEEEGTQVCREDGSMAACICAPLHGCTTPAAEFCDGVDNDCDGVVDDGEVCPDATVANTSPFSREIYFHGGRFGCERYLRRFWPTLSETTLSGFECASDDYRFRRSDGALYYSTPFDGIYRAVEEGPDQLLDVSCTSGVASSFDFDAAGTLYYRCGSELRRGDGAILANQIWSLAVLDDSRLLVTKGRDDHDDFVVLDVSGQEISRLSPGSELSGTLTASPASTYVDGNRAYVAYRRELPDHQMEIVVYRLDEASRWARVRRLAVANFGYTRRVVSDGTVFVQEPDIYRPQLTRIIAYLPDNSRRVLLREEDGGPLHLEEQGPLTVGAP